MFGRKDRRRALREQEPAVYRVVLLALCCLAVVTGWVPHRNPIRRNHFRRIDHTMSTTATVQDSALSSNWRVIGRPCDDPTYLKEIEAILVQRGKWKDECYQDAVKLYDQFMACQDSYVKGEIESALRYLNHAFRLYGPESVVCSFNGGKDAVVILHLVRAAHAHYYRLQEQAGKDVTPVCPRVIYFEHAHEFPEIQSFLRETVDEYDLEMLAFEEGTKFAEGLKVLVEKNYPSSMLQCTTPASFPVAFVLGTRTTDPNAGQQAHFAPSSHYMPPFMRVNPILEWTYGHVWHFLRVYHLPYCSLYDQGYTSLGTVKDTLPCPALAVAGTAEQNTTSIPKYWPAYMLRDWDQERAGRISKEKKKESPSSPTRTKSAKVTITDTSSSTSSLGRLSTFTEFQPTKDAVAETDYKEMLDESCVSYCEEEEFQRTVALLIIGDELLKGLTADTNTQAAAIALRKHNVLLKRVAVVSDSLEDIVGEINRLQKEVDVIITSGGVGPTHDDVTIKSVADALGCEMVLHKEMEQLLRDKMNSGEDKELTEAQVKMATLPRSSKLRYLSDNPNEWPVLQCKNIFILPGVPEFFQKKITNVAEYLSCQMERSVAYKVVLCEDEHSIVNALNKVVENHPNVTFGSYPFVSHPEYKTVITVEGRLMLGGRSNSSVFSRIMLDAARSKELMDRNVQLALDELINTLPKGSVLRVDNENLTFFD